MKIDVNRVPAPLAARLGHALLVAMNDEENDAALEDAGVEFAGFIETDVIEDLRDYLLADQP